MRIGELAKATGTKAETIRYYERAGILPAADRTDNNYRDYSQDHLAALTFVRRARELGFSMAQVSEGLQQVASTALMTAAGVQHAADSATVRSNAQQPTVA